MKNSTMRMMFAAAAMVVAAGSASAQTYKAEIPMSFRLNHTVMDAGTYEIRVSQSATAGMVIVRNTSTHGVVAVSTFVRSDPPQAWRAAGDPRIAFECAGSSCRLQKIWNGSDSSAYVFPAPKAPAGTLAAARVEVVTLAMIKGH